MVHAALASDAAFRWGSSCMVSAGIVKRRKRDDNAGHTPEFCSSAVMKTGMGGGKSEQQPPIHGYGTILGENNRQH